MSGICTCLSGHVHMCTCMCSYTCIHVCTCICGGQRSIMSVFFVTLHLLNDNFNYIFHHVFMHLFIFLKFWCMCVHVPGSSYGGRPEDSFGSQLFPYTMWVLRVEFRLSVLVTATSTHWEILWDSSFLFLRLFFLNMEISFFSKAGWPGASGILLSQISKTRIISVR